MGLFGARGPDAVCIAQNGQVLAIGSAEAFEVFPPQRVYFPSVNLVRGSLATVLLDGCGSVDDDTADGQAETGQAICQPPFVPDTFTLTARCTPVGGSC